MDFYESQAEVLKAIAHPTRLQILDILRDGEQCVCHLEAVLGMRQAYVSQQLMILRQAGLVADRKDGLRVYYHLTDPGLVRIVDQTQTVLERQGMTVSKPGLKPDKCPCPSCSPAAAS